MDGPVVTGAEMIRMIDEYGGMRWCIDGIVRFIRPPKDTSELQMGARLIRIRASLDRAPQYCKVVSPSFCVRGTWSVILEPDASRNHEMPGLKQPYGGCRMVNLHLICTTVMGKNYAPSNGTRFLLIK